MRLTNILLIVLASALPCTKTHAVNIIEKFTHDLQSSPSGYSFHHRSDSVHPGGYDSDVNHGGKNNPGQLGQDKLAGVNEHGKSGSYRVAGGYGFVISHDYGSQRSHTEAPHADAHFGASNDDLASIAVLQLARKDSGHPSMNVGEKSESIGTGKNEGVDSYIGKGIYGSYMEYDKLVKDGKKGPSIYPGEYYESDVYGGKEKYDSGDGYGGSNNGRDEGRYLESETYHGSENYNGDKHYGALEGHGDYIDDGDTGEYVSLGEYGQLSDNDAKERAESYEGYGESENNYEYEPFETNDQPTNRYGNYEAPSTYGGFDDYDTEPKFEDMRSSFLDDFFKEYNEFSKGANIRAGFGNDHKYYDDYHGDHDFEDEHSLYGEDGENGEHFFDDADSDGDHYEEEDGDKGSEFGEKKDHKKGSKTTGFRNVLHKDEFTKDHTFYEHAKNKGHFGKDGDYDEHEYRDEGGHEKGRHHDSSSDDDHHGKTDSEDKGYSFHDDLANHDEHGYKTYFDDNSDYSNGGDSRYGSEYEHGYD